MNKTLFERDTAILTATVVGYFYDFGKKYDRCRHVTCGFEYVQDYSCGYKKYPERRYYSKSDIHRHRQCSADWCRTYYGNRPKGAIPKAKLVKCKRTYFRSYTTQELADPKTKVELVAVQLNVAGYYNWPLTNIVALYDLMNDKWHDNGWWTMNPKGDLSPRSQGIPDFDPGDISGIEDVVTKVKATI